jgi:hypothetical protein
MSSLLTPISFVLTQDQIRAIHRLEDCMPRAQRILPWWTRLPFYNRTFVIKGSNLTDDWIDEVGPRELIEQSIRVLINGGKKPSDMEAVILHSRKMVLAMASEMTPDQINNLFYEEGRPLQLGNFDFLFPDGMKQPIPVMVDLVKNGYLFQIYNQGSPL